MGNKKYVGEFEIALVDVRPPDKIVYLSAFTKNTSYEAEALFLQRTLARFRLPHIILRYETRGLWIANCRAVHEMLLKVFQWFPRKDVVRLDADARIRKYPKMFDDYPFEVGFLRMGEETRGGTIFYKNCPAVVKFIRAWVDYQSSISPDVHTEREFGKRVVKSELNFDVNFPIEYCAVWNKKDGFVDGKVDLDDVVILHGQAMKKYVKKINKKTPISRTVDIFERGLI